MQQHCFLAQGQVLRMCVRRVLVKFPSSMSHQGQEESPGQKSECRPEGTPKRAPGSQGLGHFKIAHLSKDGNMASSWLISGLCTALDREGTDQEAGLLVPPLDIVTMSHTWLPIGWALDSSP